ncbi:lycopene cyclase domain-containing protein [Agromyces sp. Marseille-P2726]|uniref:lycopene cyclase domain-containing protein n=1 Tax=Agromyces sp. Marseille-P2726 TaxID=2709132 RepID=UPI00156E4283|nr:lycopene cyclase domain-containing protein [Agromyces sp. Marseille-P2726]
MTGFTYLGALLLAIASMALIDARWRLAFWRAPGAAAAAVGAGTVLLLVWDAVGIAFGVFFRGDSEFATGIVLAPELPVEEPVFLVFLCYLTLVAVLGAERVLASRDGAGRSNDVPSNEATDAASRSHRGHP